MGKTYIPATEIAKHVRKVLKDRYPDTKFSVRTRKYSGGASIRVGWTDGPATSIVKRLVERYQGVSHMDITDLVHYKDIEIDGEAARSGADYIFCDRKISAERIRKVAEWVCNDHGHYASVAEIKETKFGARVTGDATTIALEGIPGVRYLSEVITSTALDLSASEIDEMYEQHEARPWFIKVTKNGEVDARERMNAKTAARLNAGLRGNGWTTQWVPEFTDEEIVEAVMNL